MDFQSGKSFGKLRPRAFEPYHKILYMSTLLMQIIRILMHLILCIFEAVDIFCTQYTYINGMCVDAVNTIELHCKL